MNSYWGLWLYLAGSAVAAMVLIRRAVNTYSARQPIYMVDLILGAVGVAFSWLGVCILVLEWFSSGSWNTLVWAPESQGMTVGVDMAERGSDCTCILQATPTPAEHPDADRARQERGFTQELSSLLNRYSMEQANGTPDFLLAQYLIDCWTAYSNCVRARDKWYGYEARGTGMHMLIKGDRS